MVLSVSCNCAGKGNIPMCHESPIGKISIILIGSLGGYAFSKLSNQGKVIVGGLAAAGFSYAFDIHHKLNDFLFINREINEAKPVSYLPIINDSEFFVNTDIKGISAIKGQGEYKGLVLFDSSLKSEVIKINPDHHMKQIKGYISEVRGVNHENDKILIDCSDKQFSVKHKMINNVDYTLVNLPGENGYEYQLAIQGDISENIVECS